jgi:hypothetical protein
MLAVLGLICGIETMTRYRLGRGPSGHWQFTELDIEPSIRDDADDGPTIGPVLSKPPF